MMKSPSKKGNFMTNYGVEAIVPKALREGCPNNMLYKVLVSTTWNLIDMVFVLLLSPYLELKSIHSWVSTLSPQKLRI